MRTIERLLRRIINIEMVIAGIFISGCITFPKIPTSLPDVPSPTIPPYPKVCQCDLTAPVVWPLQHMGTFEQTDRRLAAGGYECGGNPLDVRISLMRPDGRAWIYKFYYSQGIETVSREVFYGRCFANPDGAGVYHFIGWSKSDLPKDIVPHKPYTSIPYTGTTFAYFELRCK